MKKIALFIEPNHGFTRRLMRGVRSFLEQRPDWVVHFGPPTRPGLAALMHWRPDGVLAHLSQVPIGALRPLRCPVVALGIPVPALPRVASVYWDRRAAGAVAGRYFLMRGFRSVAFLGGLRNALARDRLAGLRQACAPAGLAVAEYWTRQSRSERFWRWPDLTVPALGNWLDGLAKPLAVMCSNDALGRDLVEAALQLGYRVPQEVAILGSSNDDLICELAHPRLSSIEMPHERMGYRAAELLAAMLARPGRTPPSESMADFQVVTRASTDVVATDDPAVQRGISYIAEHVQDPDLDVPAISRAAGVSRRTLERRFQAELHRSVLSEVTRTRLERVVQALTSTNALVKHVAYECGFASPNRMIVAFRKATGQSPGEFRRHVQLRTRS